MEPSPINLLRHSLNEYERSLEKSKELYDKNKISAETHLTHKENLIKLITNYQQAIKLLELCEKEKQEESKEF